MKFMHSPVLTLLIFTAISMHAADIEYRVAHWDAPHLGSHRGVITVKKKGINRVRIPWRRPDLLPEKKGVIFHDPSQKKITAFAFVRFSNEEAEMVFQADQTGNYFLYYLPNKTKGSKNYPQTEYLPPQKAQSRHWLTQNKLKDVKTGSKAWEKLNEARVTAFESSSQFNSFFPMEVVATQTEVRQLVQRNQDNPFILFGENRDHPIKMQRYIPQRWINEKKQGRLELTGSRNEFLVFQVGVFASNKEIKKITTHFSDLKSSDGNLISKAALRCFNTAGVDWSGRKVTFSPSVNSGEVLSLWCGVMIPPDLKPGIYSGKIEVRDAAGQRQKLQLNIRVNNKFLPDHGDSDPQKLSRLRWLDSRLADDDSPVKPYTPLRVEKNTIRCLGRSLELAENGLPKQINSFFKKTLTDIGTIPHPILSSRIDFSVKPEKGKPVKWQAGPFRWIRRTDGKISWQVNWESEPLAVLLKGCMEFDGCVEFQVELKAKQRVSLTDACLNIPFRKDMAKFSMGLGLAGGRRPAEYQWRWQQNRNQDAFWMGHVHGGLQCSFKDKNYIRPLNTNFYQLKPLEMPHSWFNRGKGGISIKDRGSNTTELKAYAGPRKLEKGEGVNFDFRLLITPFKPLNTADQWADRYYHRYENLNKIAATGANVVNVHHATPINPYINYPFFRPREMKRYADQAHKLGMKFKIYYTVRELCNRAPELWALRSLGHEILSGGPGGGYSWLHEHLREDYIAAWFVPALTDAAVINSGVSRWHNFYVEGLNWLVKNMDIDGLYIDDVAFDRLIMKRVRRVLEKNRPKPMIDLHSANQYNFRDGFASSANLYLEHFPYIDRLWLGEYFNYDASIDYWLVEVSGIPFGLMGEMLQDGGNPWRGLLFGMTSRLPWAGDPRPIWKLWDDFGIQESEMLGWWLNDLPVQSGHKDIPLTLYKRRDRLLICLASWAAEDVEIKLQIDWNKLGLDPSQVTLVSPKIEKMQPWQRYSLKQAIVIKKGQGKVLILNAQSPQSGQLRKPGD